MKREMIMLDAYGKNPMRCKEISKTATGGVIAEDDYSIRYFCPPVAVSWRVIYPDLFTPMMPWEYR